MTHGPAGPAKGRPVQLWAYSYQFVPAQSVRALKRIANLVDAEHVAARHLSRIWAGRFVLERHISRLLIVSDSQESRGDINQRLEAELGKIKVEFFLTMTVRDGTAPAPP